MKIEIPEKYMSIIATALGELPAKVSFEVIVYLKQQIDQYNQEESAKESDENL